jgi:hypothetical protein
MLVTDIVTKAQTIAGLGVIEGNAIDENLYNLSYSIFEQTLSDINNDPKLSLSQGYLDYQKVNNMALPTKPANKPGNTWLERATNALNPPDPGADPEPPIPDPILDWDGSTSNVYPFPKDCRRVIKGFDHLTEWRKTSFSDVMKDRNALQGWQNIFAVNDKKIYSSRVSNFKITYVKEFVEIKPEDELDIPGECLPYIINRLAQDLALALNTGSIERCKVMADLAYKNLIANTTVNSGSIYINPHDSFARFDDMGFY